jgi:isoleucyl-tRNA synthetase
MQKVIELARTSRERRTLPLKQPLKTLVVIHASQEYLDDVGSLENYICEELNIQELVLTADEEKYGVQYTAYADPSVLGKKLKKDAQKVRKALPNLSSDAVKEFIKTGTIEVEDIKLVAEDLWVKRSVGKDAEGGDSLEPNTDNDVMTILDTTIDAGLAEAGLAREIINRVQRLRKKAGLVPTDDVGMEYRMLSDPEKTGIEEVFASHASMIEKALRRPIDKHVVTEVEGKIPKDDHETVIAQEEQEVQKATFMLRLVRL